MSLINDAIKRASRAAPPPPPSDGPQLVMKPVETKRPRPWFLILIPLCLLCALGLGTLFLVKGWQASVQLLARSAPRGPLPVMARETSSSMAQSTAALPNANRQPEMFLAEDEPGPPRQVSDLEPSLTPEPAAASSAASPQTAGPPPSPEAGAALSFPQLKLQGIFYRPANPSVVINTKTLYKGDRIGQATVVKISRDSVTVVWRGETKELTME